MDILVLEDDAPMRFALVQVLQDSGHTVFEAEDIATACRILERTQPDLLLLDLMIGPTSSIQVADLAGYRAPNAEIIFLTGSNRFPNGELFEITSNASWVLRKPIDFSELKAMIAHTGSCSTGVEKYQAVAS